MVIIKGENLSYYTLPEGAMEPGETLGEAAIREVIMALNVEKKVYFRK